eukprot:CAMPEP_0195070522 /NCGR_PEP_ID=MMETSP0448-20130528/14558_1 /TAXON_ID=66468 /ORGANISM="Heterocapsa triquestra, Strain CCMP 448" /LENGTH=34 /DNA_ID= /DNA_START= /DNA_END= /DNA_ORIENTATION=
MALASGPGNETQWESKWESLPKYTKRTHRMVGEA